MTRFSLGDRTLPRKGGRFLPALMQGGGHCPFIRQMVRGLPAPCAELPRTIGGAGGGPGVDTPRMGLGGTLPRLAAGSNSEPTRPRPLATVAPTFAWATSSGTRPPETAIGSCPPYQSPRSDVPRKSPRRTIPPEARMMNELVPTVARARTEYHVRAHAQLHAQPVPNPCPTRAQLPNETGASRTSRAPSTQEKITR